MNVLGTGFITILIYSNGSEASEESHSLITESGALNILTESGNDILVEF